MATIRRIDSKSWCEENQTKMLNLKNSSVQATALAVLAATVNPMTVQANEVVENNNTLSQIQDYNETQSMSQVTSVSQLRDVSPTDWAYEALRSLVERYGCIVGYPDRTFRGNRALSRYEFAAGLNACMQQMERLLAASEAVLKEDIAKLQRLMKEFEAELAALGARVDNLEGRVAFLEDHQFSTTTKLKGEVIMALVGGTGNDISNAARRQDGGAQITLNNRVRLSFDTSFTGKDKLRVRFNAGNGPNLDRNGVLTETARVNFRQNTGNDVLIDRVYYQSKIGKQTSFIVGADFIQSDFFKAYSKYTKSSGTGTLSRALRYNPFIFRQAAGAGAGVKYKFNKTFDIAASYIGNEGSADDPSDNNGLFNGSYSAGVQLGIHPTDTLDFAISYLRGFSNGDGNSPLDPTGGLSDAEGDSLFGRDFTSDNIGVQFGWRATERFNVAGWFGYSNVNSTKTSGDADLINWSVNASVLDLGKEGAVGTVAIGQAPFITSSNGVRNEGQPGIDPDPNFIIEAQYKYPVTKNISITPGGYVVFNPNNEGERDTVFVGVVRTVFKF